MAEVSCCDEPTTGVGGGERKGAKGLRPGRGEPVPAHVHRQPRARVLSERIAPPAVGIWTGVTRYALCTERSKRNERIISGWVWNLRYSD